MGGELNRGREPKNDDERWNFLDARPDKLVAEAHERAPTPEVDLRVRV